MSDTVTKPHFGTVSNICDSDSDNLALSLSQRINLFWLVTVTVPTISKDMCWHTCVACPDGRKAAVRFAAAFPYPVTQGMPRGRVGR